MPSARAPKPRFVFDAVSGRYRSGTTGRYISRGDVRQEVDRVIGKSSARVQGFGRELRDGRLTLDQWRTSMRNEIRTQHLVAAMAAKGGREQMTQSDYGRVGQLVRKQYAYLDNFAREIESGKVRLDGRFLSRSSLYSGASRGTYHAVERTEMLARGFDEEKNILTAAEHCLGCLFESARDWVPLGELAPIGQRTCRTNCKCRIQYRNSASGRRAAA
ncbi:MAG: hypothetical protein ABIW79_06795 [Gemmatimonas sp.]